MCAPPYKPPFPSLWSNLHNIAHGLSNTPLAACSTHTDETQHLLPDVVLSTRRNEGRGCLVPISQLTLKTFRWCKRRWRLCLIYSRARRDDLANSSCWVVAAIMRDPVAGAAAVVAAHLYRSAHLRAPGALREKDPPPGFPQPGAAIGPSTRARLELLQVLCGPAAAPTLSGAVPLNHLPVGPTGRGFPVMRIGRYHQWCFCCTPPLPHFIPHLHLLPKSCGAPAKTFICCYFENLVSDLVTILTPIFTAGFESSLCHQSFKHDRKSPGDLRHPALCDRGRWGPVAGDDEGAAAGAAAAVGGVRAPRRPAAHLAPLCHPPSGAPPNNAFRLTFKSLRVSMSTAA